MKKILLIIMIMIGGFQLQAQKVDYKIWFNDSLYIENNIQLEEILEMYEDGDLTPVGFLRYVKQKNPPDSVKFPITALKYGDQYIIKAWGNTFIVTYKPDTFNNDP